MGTFHAIRWQLLCTCPAPDHIQTPQSWTPCLLISALYSVCWRERERTRARAGVREGAREKEKEKEERKRKIREKNKGKEKRKEREQERECAELHHTPHTRTTTTQQHTHTTNTTPQHHMYTHNPHTRQPTVISRRKSECLDTCTSNIMPIFIQNCKRL